MTVGELKQQLDRFDDSKRLNVSIRKKQSDTQTLWYVANRDTSRLREDDNGKVWFDSLVKIEYLLEANQNIDN